MERQDLWLVRPVGGLPAGTRGTGRKFTDTCAFSPLGSSAIYRIPSAWVTDVEPPPPDVITPRLVELGQRYAPLGIVSLALLLLTGCEPVDELRAAFGFGALFGVFVAVVVAAFIVRQREQAEGLDVSRALGAPGPRIRDALRR